MATLPELRAVRLEKLELLKKAGMNPYPTETLRTHSLLGVSLNFAELESTGQDVVTVGRILSLRGQGAIMFVTLFDGTEKFQAVFKKDDMGENPLLLEEGAGGWWPLSAFPKCRRFG